MKTRQDNVAGPILPASAATPLGKGLPLCYLRLLAAPAAAQGCDVDALLRAAGLAPLHVADALHPVPLPQAARILRALRRCMRDDMLGLGTHRVRPGTFLLVIRQLLQQATLGEALRVGCSLYRVIWPDCRLRLRQDADEAVLQVVDGTAPGPWRHTQHLFLLHAVAGLMSWMTQSVTPLRQVRMPALPGCEHAPNLFTPVSQLGHAGELRFAASWLQRRVVADMRGLRAFLVGWPMGGLVPYRSGLPVHRQVLQHLRGLPAESLPTLPALARTLGWAPKALRGELAAEGHSWRSLLDMLRSEAAMRLLDRPEGTVADIGYRLGFSEPSAFHRAFKRATGQTPLDYRRQRREPVTVR